MPAMYLGMAFGVCFTFFWSLLVSIPVGQARDEQVIQQVSGKLHQHLEPFTVTDDWELRWDYKGDAGNDLFQLVLQSSPADVPVDLCVTQKGWGKESSIRRLGPII